MKNNTFDEQVILDHLKIVVQTTDTYEIYQQELILR